MSEKKAKVNREAVRAEKRQIRADICVLQEKIKAALSAPRVPDRVMAGDILVVQKWKDCMEKGLGAAYHASNEPSARLTVDGLKKIHVRLNAVLATLV